jgi:hypothetical protein
MVAAASLIAEKPEARQALATGSQVYLAISPGRGTLKEGKKPLSISAQLAGQRPARRDRSSILTRGTIDLHDEVRHP